MNFILPSLAISIIFMIYKIIDMKYITKEEKSLRLPVCTIGFPVLSILMDCIIDLSVKQRVTPIESPLNMDVKS